MWLLLLIVFQGSFSTTSLEGQFVTREDCEAAKLDFIAQHDRDYPNSPLAADPVCLFQAVDS